MKNAIVKALILLLFFITPMGYSQPNSGTVAFDAPNVPASEF